MKLSRPIEAQGPGRAEEGKGEDQIMKPTNEGKMKSPSEMSDIELREAVAVEVMGWRLVDLIPGGQWWFEGKRPVASVNDPDGGGPPLYESSIEAAFEVVAKLEAMDEHWLFKATRMIGVLRDNLDALAWAVEFRACIGPQGHAFYALGADRASLPRAICIAALTAVRARKA